MRHRHARDAAGVFGGSACSNLSLSRIVAAYRLCYVDELARHVLAFDESVAHDITEVFVLRATLHRKVYQHRAVKVVETLLVDLMHAIDQAVPRGERFIDAFHDPERFAALTDASVLQYQPADAHHPAVAKARTALFTRPFLTRVPATACVRTSPGCGECGAVTAIADAFCGRCGAPTCSRASVALLPADERHAPLLVPPECTITSDEASDEMCAALGRDDVRVFVTDVHCGSPIAVTDPHGRVWRAYDPLDRVVFVDKRGDGMARK